MPAEWGSRIMDVIETFRSAGPVVRTAKDVGQHLTANEQEAQTLLYLPPFFKYSVTNKTSLFPSKLTKSAYKAQPSATVAVALPRIALAVTEKHWAVSRNEIFSRDLIKIYIIIFLYLFTVFS